MGRSFSGMALWPFVIIRHKRLLGDTTFMNHERIHLRQQQELLVIGFYIWYGLEFLIRCVRYKNIFLGYKNISFEREAYAEENNADYLKKRKFLGFMNYLKG